MTKKHFIALADAIREYNLRHKRSNVLAQFCCPFDALHLETLAQFCAEQNSRFNRERWLAYIAGECGPNGGRK